MTAKFNLPDFWMGLELYSDLIDLMYKHPEAFYPNTEVASVFGVFPDSVWNGGGVVIGSSTTAKSIKDFVHIYNDELHLPLRFTFTNSLIGEKECYDTYCNTIMDLAHNGKNEVLVVSPILEQYLRQHYPHYKYCRSIISAKDEPYDLHHRYDLSVMRRDMNNKWDFLETVPLEQRDKIEFLCCDPCPDNCPRLYTHYRDFARAQLEHDGNAPNLACSMMEVKGMFPNYNMVTNCKTHISREMIDKEYLPRGFSQFKLSGRSNLGAMITNLVDYFIKPEYKIDAFEYFSAPYLRFPR